MNEAGRQWRRQQERKTLMKRGSEIETQTRRPSNTPKDPKVEMNIKVTLLGQIRL